MTYPDTGAAVIARVALDLLFPGYGARLLRANGYLR